MDSAKKHSTWTARIFFSLASNTASVPAVLTTAVIWWLSTLSFHYRTANNPDLMADPSQYNELGVSILQCLPDLVPILLAVALIFTFLDISNDCGVPHRIIGWLRRHIHDTGRQSRRRDSADGRRPRHCVNSRNAWTRRYRRQAFDSRHPVLHFVPILVAFIVVLTSWLVWIVGHAPGTVRDDTIPQMLQALGMYDWYTQHPVVASLIFGFFGRIGLSISGNIADGLFIYIIVQAVVTSAIVTYTVSVVRRGGLPTALLIGAVCFYAFSRMVYQPVDAMSKDSLSAMLLLLVFAIAVDVQLGRTIGAPRERISAAACGDIRSGYHQRQIATPQMPPASRNGRLVDTVPRLKRERRFDIRFIVVRCVLLSIAVILCILTKRTMGYILPVFFVVLLIFDLAKRGRRRLIAIPIVGIICSILAMFVLMPTVNAAVGADENATYEMFSVPNQQMIHVADEHREKLQADDVAALGNAFDLPRAIHDYNPWRSDEVSGTISAERYSFIGLLPTYISLGLEYPDEYAEAFFGTAGGWFDLRGQTTFAHEFTKDQMNDGRLDAWSAFFNGDRVRAEQFLRSFDPHGGSADVDSRTDFETALDSLDNAQGAIPSSSALGTYAFALPLIALAYIISRRKWVALSMMSLPALLFASLIVGPIALYWYVIPCVYIAPIMLCLPGMCFAGGGKTGID